MTAMFIKDKRFDRAQISLKTAKNDWDDIDHDQYYLYSGLLQLRQGKAKESLSILAKIEDSDLFEKKWRYTAEAQFTLANNIKALKTLNQIAGDEITANTLLLKAKILFALDRLSQGFEIFNHKKVKKLRSAKLLKIHYYFTYGLHQAAMDEIAAYLKKNTMPQEYVKMIKLLASKNDFNLAITLSEKANLTYPEDIDLKKLRISLYDAQKQYHTASDLYYQLAIQDPSTAYEASNYLLKHNQMIRGHLITMLIESRKKQLSQRLSLYLEDDQYDLASSMDNALKIFGGYQDDKIKYAMAYSFLQIGKYDESLDLIKKIGNKKLINKSIKLREMVENCKKEKWVCHATI